MTPPSARCMVEPLGLFRRQTAESLRWPLASRLKRSHHPGHSVQSDGWEARGTEYNWQNPVLFPSLLHPHHFSFLPFPSLCLPRSLSLFSPSSLPSRPLFPPRRPTRTTSRLVPPTPRPDGTRTAATLVSKVRAHAGQGPACRCLLAAAVMANVPIDCYDGMNRYLPYKAYADAGK